MLAIIQEIGVIQSVIIAACFGFLLGMLVVIAGERRKKKQHLVDYVDWSKIPVNKMYVGLQPTGCVVSFTDIPHVNCMDRWESMNKWITSDDYVGKDAIIGPLPPWRESLRRRPS